MATQSDRNKTNHLLQTGISKRTKQFLTTILEELNAEGKIVFLPHIQFHKPGDWMTC